ncbi:MAG: 4Fe-4S binding protein [Exilispira sp.]
MKHILKSKVANLMLIFTISLFILIVLFSYKIMACNITIIPSSGQYNIGDVVSIKVERIQTCGRCVLPLDQTKFSIENAEIVEISSWTKEGIKDVVFVKIKFIEVGDVKFEVVRACSKNYNVARANFTVIKANSEPQQALIDNIDSIDASSSNQPYNLNTSETSSSSPITNSYSNSLNTSVNKADFSNDKVEEKIVENQFNEFEENTEEKNSDFSLSISGDSVDVLKQSTEPKRDGFLNFIKANISYFIIGFFLLAGLLSYLLRLKFMRNILLLFSLIFLGFYLGGCPCIVGTTFGIFNIKNVNIIYLILLSFIPILSSFIWGRWFCGWFCPIGAFQKFLYSIKLKNPENIFYKINNFLKKNDKILRYTKLVIFAIFGYLYISKGYNLFCRYEPFKVIFTFNGSLLDVTIAFVLFLILTINQRFFCKYLCPVGGILKLTSRFALKKITLDKNCCTGCKICTKDICPIDAIQCNEKDNKINIDHSECIRCLKCIDACKMIAYKI